MVKFDEKAFEWLDKNQLSYDIWNKKYRFCDETFTEWLDRVSGNNENVKRLILQKKFLFGGRILANRGTQEKQKVTFSNCYVIPPVEDSIEGIYKTCAELARTYSYGGGCGVDISNLRPKGSIVNNSAKTTSGAVSFMATFDEVTKVIGQNGRRAALMISLDVNHPDVLEFVNIKTDLEKVTSANISIRVNDDFMKAVENNTDYILRYPCNVKIPTNIEIDTLQYNTLQEYNINGEKCYLKRIDANKLFTILSDNNWNYAEPGILYWDRIESYNLLNTNKDFKYAGVNPCAEEPLPAGGSCLLGSLNLSEFVTEDGNFNEIDFVKSVEIAVSALNNVLDEGLSLHPLDIQKQSVDEYRQIGLGIMGYADMLIKMKLKYGSEEAIRVTDYIGNILAISSIKQSVNIAKEKGSYTKFKVNEFLESSFFNAHINKYDNAELYEDIVKYGIRNSQLLTIAPTGSISTMLNISGGLEPIFAKSYTRTTKSLHGKDTTYVVHPQIIQDYLSSSNKTINDADDWIVSSEDIGVNERLNVQSVWQKHIDASISSTINLPVETTKEEVKELYFNAWKAGLKGVTVFRSGCARTAILNAGTNIINVNNEVIKRPKVLEADYYQVKVKGETFIVVVGMYDNKPYEVFAFRPSNNTNIVNHKGKITKVKKMHYKFESEYITIDNLELANDNIEEKAATLYTSMLLRHHADLKYIIKTTKKVNENITSFSSAMCRVLSKYLDAEVLSEKCPECGGEIVRESGCCKCNNCGWSRCE